jgi:two-component system cell cycle response regulator
MAVSSNRLVFLREYNKLGEFFELEVLAAKSYGDSSPPPPTQKSLGIRRLFLFLPALLASFDGLEFFPSDADELEIPLMPASIILIEPSESCREILAERLRMQGYNVTVAPSPAEGARLALLAPPAAVVADLWMPSISGVQLCRLLRSEPATQNVPIVLRGPDGQRNRFWAEHAGAVAYVVKGHMGDLVRALSRSIVAAPQDDGFFTDLGREVDIRDRIAAYLDLALFESVIASEVRNLSLCGGFERLFDLFSQFVCQVTTYRWLAVTTEMPRRLGLHAHPQLIEQAKDEARLALGYGNDVSMVVVEDEDAFYDPSGPAPIVLPVNFAQDAFGRLAFAGRNQAEGQEHQIMSIIARELGGPLRMATLVEEAQRLATVDSLTGLMNRRAFLHALEIEIERAIRLDTTMAVVLLDVDHFKAINDSRGHASGDTVLSAIGHLIGREARKLDLAARWGGEEFVLVLVGADHETSLVAAERYRASVERMVVSDSNGKPIPVTASFGIAVLEPNELPDSVIDRADRAMYAAKTAGRNCIRLSTPMNEQPSQVLATSTDDPANEPVASHLPVCA